MAFDTPPDISQTPYSGSKQPGLTWANTAASLDDINRLMGANQQTNASNLSTELANRLANARLQNDMASTYQNAMNTRTQTNATAQTDAWRKLQQAEFVKNFNPATYGPNLSKNPYFQRLQAPSANVVAGATSLGDTMRDSLMSGQYTNNGGAPLPAINSQPSEAIDPRLLTPPKQGTWSKILKYAAIAAPYVAAPFTGGASLALAPMTASMAKQ
jgi:hypothetical protein